MIEWERGIGAWHPECSGKEIQPKPKRESAPPAITDGTYSVVMSDDDSDYVTVKIETLEKGKLAGSTIVSYLRGPDNEREFTAFAFLDGDQVRVWRKFKESAAISKYRDAVTVILGAEDKAQFGERYALLSNRCWRCGRTLTVPTSIKRGLGPDCAELLGY